MPERARERLAATVTAARLPTIEDDTLIDLGFEQDAPPRVATFAPDAPTFNVASLSKLYWAGLRVGWPRVRYWHAQLVVHTCTLSDFGSRAVCRVSTSRCICCRTSPAPATAARDGDSCPRSAG